MVLCILFAWNDFLFAAIIGSGGAKTLPVATRELVQPQNIQSSWPNVVNALVMIATILRPGIVGAAIGWGISRWMRARRIAA